MSHNVALWVRSVDIGTLWRNSPWPEKYSTCIVESGYGPLGGSYCGNYRQLGLVDDVLPFLNKKDWIVEWAGRIFVLPEWM